MSAGADAPRPRGRRRRSLAAAWRWGATAALLVGIALAVLSTPGLVPAPPAVAGAAARAEVPEALRPVAASAEGWLAATPAQRAAYAAWLLDRGLAARRADVERLLAARAAEHTRVAAAHLDRLFGLLALASLGIALLPLLVGRRVPGSRKALWVRSALTALILALTFLLLGGVANLLVVANAGLASAANPGQGLVDAAFVRVEASARGLLVPGEGGEPLPLGVVVGDGANPYDEHFLGNLLESLRTFDPAVFRTAAVWTHRVWTLLGFLPHVVPYLMALVFLLTLRGTLVRIAAMPLRAAQGEAHPVLRTLGLALGTVLRELLAILLLVVVLVGASLLTQLAVRHLARSVVAIAFEQTRTTIEYFGRLGAPPDETALDVATLALPAYLVLATLLVILALAGVGLWARRVTQLRVHEGVRLRAHDGFWRSALLALLRLQWIPVLVLAVLAPGLARLHAGAAPTAEAAMQRMVLTAGLLGAGLLVGFVALRGPQAVGWMLRFRPRRGEEVRAPSPPPAASGGPVGDDAPAGATGPGRPVG